MAPENIRPTTKEFSLALICLILVLGGAFITASRTYRADLQVKDEPQKQLFKLTPPCEPDADCNRTPVEESKRLDLHRTFLTAWAALILVTPAICMFWFRRTSAFANRYWLAFWTVSFIAFLVHFYWAVFVIFDGDWSRIFDKAANGMRVTLPRFDTLFTFWWGFDVLLAWLIRSGMRWIRIQRILVHLVAFGLFFAGSFREGENIWSRSLGLAMGIVVGISFLVWLRVWVKSRKANAVARADEIVAQ